MNVTPLSRAPPWLELAQVQKRLADDTTLVAIARFPLFNFKAAGEEKRWQPPHYVAWLIEWNDLAEAQSQARVGVHLNPESELARKVMKLAAESFAQGSPPSRVLETPAPPFP